MADSINILIKKIDKMRKDRDWDQFHSLKNLAISLNLEATELHEKFQWNDKNDLSKKETNEMYEELADVFINTVFLSLELNVDLLKLVRAKLKKIDTKYPIDKMKGISSRQLREQGKITKKIDL